MPRDVLQLCPSQPDAGATAGTRTAAGRLYLEQLSVVSGTRLAAACLAAGEPVAGAMGYIPGQRRRAADVWGEDGTGAVVKLGVAFIRAERGWYLGDEQFSQDLLGLVYTAPGASHFEETVQEAAAVKP